VRKRGGKINPRPYRGGLPKKDLSLPESWPVLIERGERGEKRRNHGFGFTRESGSTSLRARSHHQFEEMAAIP